MNKIDQRLEILKQQKRLGLMTHVVVGYPSLESTEKIVHLMAEEKVDFIELQIPFSDPLADGPTIMRACEQSLERGTKVKDAFLLAKKMSLSVDTPLLFMAYYNTVFKYGVEKFCQDAKGAGISGLIVPDMPLEEEEGEKFGQTCLKYSLTHIRVLSPASTEERIIKNANVAKGFVYFTSRQGTTGVTSSLDDKLSLNINRLKKHIKIPIGVGFGISKPEHIQALKDKANIAVVGSAVLDIINTHPNDFLEHIRTFLKGLIHKL
jgi:tryptophan synthase alpha subunit